MESTCNNKLWADAAYGAIVADGCFALAFTLHLLGEPSAPSLGDFFAMGIIICVFFSACWVIYDNYWATVARTGLGVVKKLRIKELEQGACIEYDGKSYRVEAINRASGEVLIQRIGHPGKIIVQIEGQGEGPKHHLYGQ